MARKDKVGRTAFYTAAVWYKLGVPGAGRFVTWQGRLLRSAVEFGGNLLWLRGPYDVTNLFLKARHLGLNQMLEQSQPPQVVELAAGLSSRGLETTRWRACRYVEVDQPAVVHYKKALLAGDKRPLAPDAVYQLIEADLLNITGKELAVRLQPFLDPAQPVLLLTEGMTGYLGEPAMRQLLKLLRDMAAELGDVTLLVDFYLRINSKAHGRLAWAMWPAFAFWRLIRAPMRMFLQDKAQINQLATEAGFEVERLYSAYELADLAGIARPPINLFYLAQMRVCYNTKAVQAAKYNSMESE